MGREDAECAGGVEVVRGFISELARYPEYVDVAANGSKVCGIEVDDIGGGVEDIAVDLVAQFGGKVEEREWFRLRLGFILFDILVFIFGWVGRWVSR